MAWSNHEKGKQTRTKEIELKTRAMVSHMAVNCRTALEDIESINKWKTNPRIVPWHMLLTATQAILLKKPIQEEPAEAPPFCLDVSDVDAESGSAGGGEESCGGASDVPTAAKTFLPWDDVVGNK